MKVHKVLVILLLALSSVLVAIQTIDYINFGVDDIFISLRVASNVASGNGFVYNVGEYVEGFSDPLWVAILAAIQYSGIATSESGLLWSAKGLSYAFGLSTFVLLFIFVRRLFRGDSYRSIYAALAVLSLASCSAFILWSCGALEMTMVAFFYLAALFVLEQLVRKDTARIRYYLLLALLFALASYTRPEPPLFAVAIIGYLLLISRDKFRVIFWCLLPYLSLLLVLVLWRWTLYHDLLPNTFYAKTGGGAKAYILGVKYLLACFAGLCGPLLFVIPLALSNRGRNSRFMVCCMIFILVASVFTVYSSGDWMPGFRFLIPIAPILIVVSAIGLRLLVERLRGGLQLFEHPAAAVTMCVFLSLSSILLERVTLRGQHVAMATGFSGITGHSTVDHEAAARWVKEHSHGQTLVATGEAGLIGFRNPSMRLLDMNGLMDKKIARDRKAGKSFDAEYILKRAPEYVLFLTENCNEAPSLVATAGNSYNTQLQANNHFKSAYHYVTTEGSFAIYGRN